ncbi:MAG TPA: T9SS type A sorting domain-containing protein, partial [Candidatus Kapabacteria bacterium]|nr:T9SS type A sorting domain-containing protein [Candidatus Kapabacteria bacterium]
VLNPSPSAGYAMIIAPYDATTIEITPTSTTAGGHTGYRCGSVQLPTEPPAFTATLNRGQCYFFKSSATDNSCDLSNSTIRSNNPIAVLAGHENAFIDGSEVDGGFEMRDFMIEQLLPVECFDTTGYYVVPLLLNPAAGNGDEIRLFCDGKATAAIFRTNNGKDGIPMPSSPYQNPPSSKTGNDIPLAFYSTNGKPFSVMLYDQRQQASNFYPSPSMMSIIPQSRWKSNYYWTVQDREGSALYGNYVNLICKASDWNNGQIKVSVKGAPAVNISSALSVKKTWPLVAGSDLIGVTFSASPGSYHVFSTKNQTFTLYNYGWQVFDPDGDPPEEESFYYSYASPMGMTYGEFGVPPSRLSYTVTDHCDHWQFCVTDSGTASNGLRYIEILNYDNPSFLKARAKDVAFDSKSDPLGKGDIILDGTPKEFCFSVQKKSAAAHAVIAFYDNSGQSKLIDITNTTIFPISSSNGDLIQKSDTLYDFTSTRIDSQVCGIIVIRRSDTTQSIGFVISNVVITQNKGFTITSPLPSFPITLYKADSIVLSVCYTPKDTFFHSTSIQVVTNCPDNFTYTLRGRGSEGLITASDVTFSDIKTGAEECKTVSVKNIGTYPFSITGYSLDDRQNFALNSSFVLSLPITVPPGASISSDVCFHPQDYGNFTGRIDWKTDLIDQTRVKAYSLLNGKSSKPTNGVEESPTTEVLAARYERDQLIINIPPIYGAASFELFDILGRMVDQWEVQPNAETTIAHSPTKLPAGAYILRLQSGTMVKSCTVILR